MIAREVLAKTAAWLTIKNPQDGKCCSNVAHSWCYAAANAMFHFANAPMLLLLGQKLALSHPGQETAFVSASIITAQLVTIPHCVAGWMEGQYLGTKVPFAGRVRGAANPRFVVYNFR